MQVRVYVTEVSKGFVDIEVNDESEIERKVDELYGEGEIKWTGGTFEINRWNALPNTSNNNE